MTTINTEPLETMAAAETASDINTNLFVDPTNRAGYARAIRSQADNNGDWWSWATGVDTGDEIHTRQELAEETDINNILAKYGINQQQRPMTYGATIDYSLDLQTALAALAQVKTADFKVPPELQAKYRTWQSILNAAESGEYKHDLQNLAEQKKRAEDAQKAAAEAEQKITVKPEASPKI